MSITQLAALALLVVSLGSLVAPTEAATAPPAASLVGLKTGYDITSTRVVFRSSGSIADVATGQVVEGRSSSKVVTETIHVNSEVVAVNGETLTVRTSTTAKGVTRTWEQTAHVDEILVTLPAPLQDGTYRQVTQGDDFETTRSGRVAGGWLDETVVEATLSGWQPFRLQITRIADPSLQTPAPAMAADQAIWLLPWLIAPRR